ncbi:MAG: dethiobiotin synthase [Flavobacteriales bacterium]
MPKHYFITGIGTDVGKTVCSAILVQQFGFDYWKPVQAGLHPETDTERVRSLVSRTDVTYHPEKYRLKLPASPHLSAHEEGVEIKLSDFSIPSSNSLLIEGAGGLLVPINYNGDTIADMIDYFDAELILVSRHYLGSINHTLLSIEVARSRGLVIAGIVFNGKAHHPTEQVILKTGVKFLGRIDETDDVNKEFVKSQITSIVLTN